jgi:hypothetical protein
MRRKLLLSLISFFLLPLETYAIQEAPETWPIEERCIGETTQAPANWKFEGTLLLRSSGKLHAYHQGWETPRILVFYDADSGAVLSPDRRWLAVAVIEGRTEETNFITTFKIDALHIYSTVSDEEYVVEWKNEYRAVHRVFGHRLYWLDNSDLLYSRDGELDETWYVINPFSGAISDWQGGFAPSNFEDVISPDAAKLLYHVDWTIPEWILDNGKEEFEIPLSERAVWKPDSSSFGGYIHKPDQFEADQLAIFDLNGNITDILFDVPESASPALNLRNNWSPDGRYFLFAVDQLYIADTQTKRVIDTCIASSNYVTVVWSPSHPQFALVEPYSDSREVQIFDMEIWERYVVAYHSGEVIGWREDE